MTGGAQAIETGAGDDEVEPTVAWAGAKSFPLFPNIAASNRLQIETLY